MVPHNVSDIVICQLGIVNCFIGVPISYSNRLTDPYADISFFVFEISFKGGLITF